MPDVVLATFNAKHAHASLGLRCLFANLGPLQARAALREFTLQDRPIDAAEALLALSPRVVGLGVYVWNARHTLEVVQILRAVAPRVRIVLGGPEVSFPRDAPPVAALADVVVTGEGEAAFLDVCHRLLSGGAVPAVVPGGEPALGALALPYAHFTDDDLRSRVVSVELSRGCPFRCEFCLSSLDERVRPFPTEPVLAALDALLARGARQFKFVDRTFNIDAQVCEAVLRFFLDRQAAAPFAHFELVPGRLPPSVRALAAQFPPGRLQFEVGIQTFDAEVSRRISRPLDVEKVEESLRFLATTGVHVHADLIVGLPGEGEASFGRGFDRLVALAPAEIQVGILKRLRGAPIVRHDQAFAQIWAAEAPYELLSSAALSFDELQRLKRFARAWDVFANRGRFRSSLPLLWAGSSPFAGFRAFVDWLTPRVSLGGVALLRQVELLFEFLVRERGVPAQQVGPALVRDYVTAPGRHVPAFLAEWRDAAAPRVEPPASLPKRQREHARARS